MVVSGSPKRWYRWHIIIGGMDYATYHLLGEPETTSERISCFNHQSSSHLVSGGEWTCQGLRWTNGNDVSTAMTGVTTVMMFYSFGCWTENRGGPPKWMVKIMENPIKMDDLGVPYHYFWKHPFEGICEMSWVYTKDTPPRLGKVSVADISGTFSLQLRVEAIETSLQARQIKLLYQNMLSIIRALILLPNHGSVEHGMSKQDKLCSFISKL